MAGMPEVWGATAIERAMPYPCDSASAGPAESWFRAVTVDAPRPRLFRWLCQLKVAPYSYDLVDNLGRRSPRTLTPGVQVLRRGERMMTIFELVDFEPDVQLTLRMTSRSARAMFGPLTLTYAVRDDGPDRCRLVAKLNVGASRSGALDALRRRALAWGDLVMMRRQLLNLRDLAQADSSS